MFSSVLVCVPKNSCGPSSRSNIHAAVHSPIPTFPFLSELLHPMAACPRQSALLTAAPRPSPPPLQADPLSLLTPPPADSRPSLHPAGTELQRASGWSSTAASTSFSSPPAASPLLLCSTACCLLLVLDAVLAARPLKGGGGGLDQRPGALDRCWKVTRRQGGAGSAARPGGRDGAARRWRWRRRRVSEASFGSRWADPTPRRSSPHRTFSTPSSAVVAPPPPVLRSLKLREGTWTLSLFSSPDGYVLFLCSWF